MAFMESNNDGEFLYTPPNSQAHKDREIAWDLFPSNATAVGDIILFRNDRANAWTREGIAIANDINKFAVAIEAEHKGISFPLSAICLRNRIGECEVRH